MKKSELSQELKDLRGLLGNITQADLAKLMEVSPQTISAWEAEGMEMMPSSESFMRLGNLAPFPLCVSFYEEAGMDRNAMLSMAIRILKQRRVELPEGKMVAVPRLRKKGETNSNLDLRFFDARDVPNPGAAAYWEGRVNGLLTLPFPVRILLDTFDNNPTDLRTFWDTPILVESVDPITCGLYIGELGFEPPPLPLGDAHPVTGYATLVPFSPIESKLKIGSWEFSQTTGKARLKKSGTKLFDLPLVNERAKEEMRLLPGWTIVGRVLDLHFMFKKKG